MQARSRSTEGSQSGVPSWLLEEHQQQQQLQQQRQEMAAQTPTRNRCAATTTEGKSAYGGLCRGSPDTRRTHYKSTTTNRQQQREQRHQRQQQIASNNNPLELRSMSTSTTTTRPQHQVAGSTQLQRMPASEPIYLDIDPSIHQPSSLNCTANVPTPTPAATAATATTEVRPLTPPSAVRPPSRQSMSSNSQSQSNHSSPSPSYSNANTSSASANNNKSTHSSAGSSVGHLSNNSRRSPNNSYTYVNPYVSSVARDYRVPGGMFRNQPFNTTINTSTSSSNTSKRQPSPYNDTPIGPNKYGVHQHHQGLIMFGDDYDLGSINTGMSQQELLQKRRDVKKRREGKYAKKKKPHKQKKERIINMPPRLLSMGSWDTSPITKFTSRDNSQHTPYKNSKEEKQPGQWNVRRAFSGAEEDSTDLSTRESGDPQDPALSTNITGQQFERAPPPLSDNISLSSFPLLSTNAKEGLATEETVRPEARVQYVQPGNIPQLQMHHQRVAIHAQHDRHDHQQQQLQQQYQQQLQAQYRQPQHQQTQAQSPSRPPRPEHMDIYQRQHSEELQQLEHHLHYLQEQHHQLEQEIEERQKQQKVEVAVEMSMDEYEDNRPRAVRFASKIAQSIEEDYEAPSDESTSRIHKDSPTSVAQFDDSNEQDKSNNSVIAPKTLFVKPKSILRRNGQAPLDSTGRDPGANRGRSHVPLFTDSTGREVSPIRSPGRQQAQQAVFQLQSTPAAEDVGSIPDNPDDKDIEVMFDSDANVNTEHMQREFDDDSGLISDAFIEAVAAIVLQTAFRRFLAIRLTRKIRMGHNSTENDGRHEASNLKQRSTASPGRKGLHAGDAAISMAAPEVSPYHGELEQGNPKAQEEFFYDLAAIQIQCVFRGWWVRDSINVDHYCSTLIQKCLRGYRARLDYDYDLYRIVLVQSIWRKKLVVRSIGKKTPQSAGIRKTYEKARMQQKLHKKQQRLKAKSSKRETPQPPSAEEAGIWQVAAIIIQTYWRSYVSRISYLQAMSDVVVVQSVARRWLTRRWLGISMTRSAERYNHGRSTIASPHIRHSTPPRGAGRFEKFESFESRTLSSLGVDESIKMSSLDESVPSVPFRILTDEDPEQPPSLTPPRKGKDHQMQKVPGHFEDPSRFGGSKNCWPGYGHATPQSSISYKKPAVGHSNGQAANGRYTASDVGPSNQQLSPARSGGSPGGSPGGTKEIPRSKGWNAEEDIDKEGTRSLLMAWKQKDKANSFTIRPRNGY